MACDSVASDSIKGITIVDSCLQSGKRLEGTISVNDEINLARRKLIAVSVDVGASQMIIDEKIKLKNDSQIERFTKSGLRFEDGSELPADAIVFATGCVAKPTWLFLLVIKKRHSQSWGFHGTHAPSVRR